MNDGGRRNPPRATSAQRAAAHAAASRGRHVVEQLELLLDELQRTRYPYAIDVDTERHSVTIAGGLRVLQVTLYRR